LPGIFATFTDEFEAAMAMRGRREVPFERPADQTDGRVLPTADL
jgi:hypothetical protein